MTEVARAPALTDAEKLALLKEALEEAQAHLEYCGWGDRWERECAREAKLPEKIQAALDAVKTPLQVPCPGPLSARQLRGFTKGFNDYLRGVTEPPRQLRQAWLRGFECARTGATS